MVLTLDGWLNIIILINSFILAGIIGWGVLDIVQGLECRKESRHMAWLEYKQAMRADSDRIVWLDDLPPQKDKE